ncbi:uncharacterized protein LOC121651461 [Melanotaenia boesemani]|uniref:uncharacterized protein LOC121651461 n=1 Tax=Melanotaenia boesemani TaxID=1250792 RepID=UPI001C04F615|nr:uncharacterized protein LOC121651461 [Melanotaenia boesemani]
MRFPLWLLICALSTALMEAESDQERFAHLKQTGSQGKEPANEQQQTCSCDIHAVLREMSASLAALKVEVKYLQRENEEQAAKLGKLELQETKLDELKQQCEAQAEELITIKTRANITENQVEALKIEGKVKQVAFSTSLLDSASGYVGPFNTETNLVFRHVVTNVGNAYNQNTGFFTAPVRGVYHFEFYMYGHGHDSHGSGGVLVKNGKHVFNAYDHRATGDLNSANGVTLLLDVGDIVFMRQWANTRIYDNENCHTTFSGHLVFHLNFMQKLTMKLLDI